VGIGRDWARRLRSGWFEPGSRRAPHHARLARAHNRNHRHDLDPTDRLRRGLRSRCGHRLASG